jgi:hypothetical protein
MDTNKEINGISDVELVAFAGSTVIGTSSGLKAQHAQAELTRRLMETIREANKSTTRHSTVTLGFTFVLFVTAILQLAAAIFSLPFEMFTQISSFIVAFIIIGYTFWLIERDLFKKIDE